MELVTNPSFYEYAPHMYRIVFDRTLMEQGPGLYAMAQAWNGETVNVSNFDTVEFQISAATGGPWIPKRSLDGVVWDACQVTDQTGSQYSTITTALIGKCLMADGRGYFRLYPNNVSDSITSMIRAS